MWIMVIDPGTAALIGTVISAIGVPIIVHFLNKRRDITNDAANIRNELRLQIEDQKKRMEALEASRNEWMQKYYDLRDSYITQHTELVLALEQIKVSGQPVHLEIQGKDNS